MSFSLKTILGASVISCALTAAVYAEDDYTVIKVDGEEITKSEIDMVWEGLFPPGAAPAFDQFDAKVRENVLRGIISEHILYKEAEKQKISDDPVVQRRAELERRKVIVQALLEKESDGFVNDDDLQAAYDEFVRKQRDEEELKARHILVGSKSEAEDIKETLEEGKDFEELAKEKSSDKASGAVGGDLGWFAPDSMVPAFSAAAKKLKKGEVSDPVESNFGWHIIKLEDRRKAEIPTFQDLKPKLKKSLEEKGLETYVESLMKDTDVTVYDESGDVVEFNVIPKDE